MDIKGNLKKYLEDSIFDNLGEIVILRSMLKSKEQLLEEQNKQLERLKSYVFSYEDECKDDK